MADVVCNIAKGRIVELYNRVKNNDPANSAFLLVGLTGVETDDNIRDADTLTAIIALALNEVTNGGYARKVLTDADIASLPAPDDTNNWYGVDLPDWAMGTILAGDNWSRVGLCYDGDTTSGGDANIMPLIVWDYVLNADGSSVTLQFNASGIFRAT
jgi:hypothetical protein